MKNRNLLKFFVLALIMAGSITMLHALTSVSGEKSVSQEPTLVSQDPVTIPAPEEQEDTLIRSSPEFAIFSKIMERYERPDYLLKGRVTLSSSNNKRTPETVHFTSISAGASHLYEVDSVQTITTDDFILMIDHSEKQMALLNEERKPGRAHLNNVSGELKKVSRFMKAIEIHPAGKENRLSIVFSETMPGNISSYNIWFDPASYQVSRIKMEMVTTELVDPENKDDATEDGEPPAELIYIDSTDAEVPTGMYGSFVKRVYEIVCIEERNVSKEAIDIKKYVKKEGEHYGPSGDYKHYSIFK